VAISFPSTCVITISAEPSKLTPLIVRAVSNVVAVFAATILSSLNFYFL